jgi:hypothetical protein
LAIVVEHRIEIAPVNQVFKEVKLNRGSHGVGKTDGPERNAPPCQSI